jgi:hypothetical protein
MSSPIKNLRLHKWIDLDLVRRLTPSTIKNGNQAIHDLKLGHEIKHFPSMIP